MLSGRPDDWCILTTSPGQTLGLAKALTDAAYPAWTPTEVTVKRVGSARKRVERPVPITPTFVFVRYDWLGELVALARSPSMTHMVWDADLKRMVRRGFPQFTVFRSMGKYPRIADYALDPLRRMERRCKLKVEPTTFKAGDAVIYPDAGFEGLTGTVMAVRGNCAVVTFPGLPFEVKIDPRYLQALGG